MANNLMICEPNSSLPQKIVLGSLRKSNKYFATKNAELKAAAAEKLLAEEQQEFDILPVYNRQGSQFRSTLSLDTNEYLRCRWEKFLEKKTEKYVRIKLYKDIIPKKKLERSKTLNGQFDGIDFKLAPIPVMPDPRQYDEEPCVPDRCPRMKRLSKVLDEMYA